MMYIFKQNILLTNYEQVSLEYRNEIILVDILSFDGRVGNTCRTFMSNTVRENITLEPRVCLTPLGDQANGKHKANSGKSVMNFEWAVKGMLVLKGKLILVQEHVKFLQEKTNSENLYICKSDYFL